MGERTLRRPLEGRVLGGVCAAWARFFDIDPTAVRVAYVILSAVTCSSLVLVYLILWWVIPAEEEYR